MPNCCLCGASLAGRGYWTIPAKGGIIAVCLPCTRAPRIEPPGGAVLIDKDGREHPVEVKQA